MDTETAAGGPVISTTPSNPNLTGIEINHAVAKAEDIARILRRVEKALAGTQRVVDRGQLRCDCTVIKQPHVVLSHWVPEP